MPCPSSALMHLGDKTILQVGEKTFCWMYEDGRAKRIEVETGVERRRVDRGHQSPRSTASRSSSAGDETVDAVRRHGSR